MSSLTLALAPSRSEDQKLSACGSVTLSYCYVGRRAGRDITETILFSSKIVVPCGGGLVGERVAGGSEVGRRLYLG